MFHWDWEKFWQRSIGVALPCVILSVALDRNLRETLMSLWDNPAPLRLLFFISSAFLCVGLARNSARLRKRAASHPVQTPPDLPHHRRSDSSTTSHSHTEREPNRESAWAHHYSGGGRHVSRP